MKYEIGQQVWLASWEAETDCVECPDCAGTGRIRVMLPDDTIVRVECEGCRSGYEGPKGYLKAHVRRPRAVLTTIKGVEISNGNTEVIGKFSIEDEARSFAIRLAEQTVGRTLTIAKVVATYESKANVSVQSH